MTDDGYMVVPPRLRPVLNLYGQERRTDIAEQVAAQLRLCLPHRDLEPGTVDFLVALVDGLADALAEGRMLLDDRAGGIARRATRDLTVDDLLDVCDDLGWNDHKLPRCTVADLPVALSEAVAACCQPFVANAMRRWEEAGYFELYVNTRV